MKIAVIVKDARDVAFVDVDVRCQVKTFEMSPDLQEFVKKHSGNEHGSLQLAVCWEDED